MKKFMYLALALILAAGVTSCKKGNAGKSGLNDEVDSLSYAIGMQYGKDILRYGEMNGMDSAYVNEFYRGIKKAFKDGGNDKQEAYNIGVAIGSQLYSRMFKGVNEQLFAGDSTQSLSEKKFFEGFMAAAKNKDLAFTDEDAQMYAQIKFGEIQHRSLEAKFADNKAAGEKFLAANKKKPGVVTLPSGVQYKVLKQGTGAIVPDSVTVDVNYEGRLIDGTVFDSSEKQHRPATMTARGTIQGFAEVLKIMPVGSTWEVYIPQDKAYGDRNMGTIKPFSALIFKLELLGEHKK